MAERLRIDAREVETLAQMWALDRTEPIFEERGRTLEEKRELSRKKHKGIATLGQILRGCWRPFNSRGLKSHFAYS